MNDFQFDGTNVTAHFDVQTGYLYVSYRDVISAETTASVYAWGAELAKLVGITAIKAMLVNFQAVSKFDYNNLRTASKASRTINQEFDLSHLPVALIVKNMYQEQMVGISMKLMDQTQRMQMVYTEEEALKFVVNWQKANSPTSTTDEETVEK